MDPIDKARKALQEMKLPEKPAKPARTTVGSVVEKLLPDIEVALKRGFALDDLLPVIEKAYGKPIAKPTLASTLCRERKAARPK